MYLNEPATRRFRAPTKKDGMPAPSGFIRPCQPVLSLKVPVGDGFRIVAQNN